MDPQWLVTVNADAGPDAGFQRILCCSDIHGHRQALERGLEKASYKPKQDLLLVLGDLIDRGPDPVGVVSYLMNCRAQAGDSVIVLKGNHEDMLLGYWDGGWSKDILIRNGALSTLEAYETLTAKQRQRHEQFLRSLPLACIAGDWIFVHAGLKPNIPLAEQKPEDLLWIRNAFLKAKLNDVDRTVVFGHTPTFYYTQEHSIYFGDNKIGIDTGAAYGGPLSILSLPSQKSYQVPTV